MSKKKKSRQYPSFWSIKPKRAVLQVTLIENVDTENIDVVTDNSEVPESNAWVYRVNNTSNREFAFFIDSIAPREKDFIRLLINEDFSDYEPSESAQLVFKLQRKSPSAGCYSYSSLFKTMKVSCCKCYDFYSVFPWKSYTLHHWQWQQSVCTIILTM